MQILCSLQGIKNKTSQGIGHVCKSVNVNLLLQCKFSLHYRDSKTRLHKPSKPSVPMQILNYFTLRYQTYEALRNSTRAWKVQQPSWKNPQEFLKKFFTTAVVLFTLNLNRGVMLHIQTTAHYYSFKISISNYQVIIKLSHGKHLLVYGIKFVENKKKNSIIT